MPQESGPSPGQAPPGGPGRALRRALLPALALYALLAWRLDFVCDDAFISFRYARNLAEGHGLRFNLTTGPPVEGYSNFLWVLWLGLLHGLGLDIVVASRVSSALCGAALVAVVTRLAQRRLALSPAGTLATALFAASLPPVALWATGGLATMPTALFVALAFERLLGDPERPRGWQAGALAALAALTRADGAAWGLMLLGGGFLAWLVSGRERRMLVAGLQAFAVLALVVGAHVAWRLGYYGDFLPNTARVKAGFSRHRLERGLDYVAATLLTLPAIPAALLLSIRGWRAELVRLWLPLVLMLAGTLAYGAYVGGDFMPMGRFLFPALALSPLLLGLAWRGARGRVRTLALGAASAGLVALNVLACFDRNPVPDEVLARFHFRQDRAWESEVQMRTSMNERARGWMDLGRALALHTRAGETMVAGPIGARSFYSRLDFYDIYGLVTPEVIGAAEPRQRSSPGHDLRVDYLFFNHHRPTYVGAFLSRVDAPLSDQVGDWERHPFARLARLERYPLRVEDGFEEGAELRLVRFLRWE
jgi:arabinofuranosyltransferase